MLKITVKNQMLCLSEEVVAENSAQFAVFSASFSSEWDEYEKTVRFRHAEGGTVYDVAHVMSGSEYFIPAEVLHRGRVYVSCVGVKGTSSIATATRESFEVRGSLISGEGTVPTVTPNAYAQYVELVKDRAEEVNGAADRAEQYAKQAEDAKENSVRNAASAVKSANAAKGAENRAEDHALSAAVSEASAKTSLNLVMSNVNGIDEKCLEKKNELDRYTDIKKRDIDAYVQKSCLEVDSHADELKKDFSANADLLSTGLDVKYTEKSDLLSQKADGYISDMKQYAANAQSFADDSKKYADEANDSAFSASVCKNQTLNALSSALQSEQKAYEHASDASFSSKMAAEKAAEAHNSALELAGAKDSFYTRIQADKRFDTAYYSFKKAHALYLPDADTEAELKSFAVYGNTERSHIPTSDNPCEITSFDGKIIFCGENVLDPDKCEYLGVVRENDAITADFDGQNTYGTVRMNGFIPFLRPGETYTLTVKSDIVTEGEKTAVILGKDEFIADAAAGFVTFTVPYTYDMSLFEVRLSYFEEESASTVRTRRFTSLGLNRGISPVYTPYNGYVLSVGQQMNGIMVYNGKNGNPAERICDSVEYRDGILKYVRRIGKHIFKGDTDENWSYLPGWEKPDTVGFYCKVNGKGNYPVICNRFDYNGTNSEAKNEQIACNGAVDCVYVQIRKSALEGWSSSLSFNEQRTLMRNWASKNNIIVYYILKEPEETVISTNLIFPDKNIYCTFPGVTFEAEYKPCRNGASHCTVMNKVSGRGFEMSSGSDNMKLEAFEIKGDSVQSTPGADSPQNIESFGNVVIAYSGKNRTNSDIYTAKYAECINGIIKVTLPAGSSHAELYDETLNYSLEGSKTYTMTVECADTMQVGERIGIEINGTAYYSAEKGKSVTFKVPSGAKEKKVKIFLCCFDAPLSSTVTRTYGGLRITEGTADAGFSPYCGSLVFLKDTFTVGSISVSGFLRACGDVRDTVCIDEKKAILEKNVEYMTCKSSHSYYYESSNGTEAVFRLVPPNYKQGKVYCSHFPELSQDEFNAGNSEGIRAYENGIMMRVRISRITGYGSALSDSDKAHVFAEWISGKSAVLQYPARHPSVYDISESTLAKSILKLRTHRETVYINSVFDSGSEKSSATAQGEISVAYPCDIAEFINFKTAESARI